MLRLVRLTIIIAMIANSSLADTTGQSSERVDLLLLGGTIVTMDQQRRVIEDGAIAIAGGRIAAVGTRSEIQPKFKSRQTIDTSGRLILPGLINGHTHIPMTLFRGLADDLDLQEWLTKYIFPAEAKNVTEDFVRAGTRL